ncbi:unnamed protein product [Didymodactylos carnosus]|uniref:DNA topoisomerase I n=1 Tax=Didymodactylos carnosus TaxID=1234261 RepID=A0A813YIS3_9BILA|nr:unnamed protein product [Didymodactylos carnosus]CAF0885141.1 unnamed protein product [Didymodactylos carnosus]CAF3553144.1 unnamed protein product [Didymodactylos carnosus]CAF3670562.1 unnamed protein product [Didymodactylos carnosus]
MKPISSSKPSSTSNGGLTSKSSVPPMKLSSTPTTLNHVAKTPNSTSLTKSPVKLTPTSPVKMNGTIVPSSKQTITEKKIVPSSPKNVSVKKEPIVTPKRKTKVLESDEDSDDDKPLAKKMVTNSTPKSTPIVKTEPKEPKSTPTVKTEPKEPKSSSLSNSTPIQNNVSVKKEPTVSSPKRKNTVAESDDDVPLSKKIKQAEKAQKPVKIEKATPEKGKTPSSQKTSSTSRKSSTTTSRKTPTSSSSAQKASTPQTGGKRKIKEEEDIWRWWEEEKYTDGRKWTTLDHRGPVFAPPYEPLPNNIKFSYNATHVKLSEPAEEIMTFYAKMLDHDYTKKQAFNTNFMTDWRKSMTPAERELIKDIRKCDFTQVCQYFKELTEQRKAMTKEDKKVIKEENEKLRTTYGFCMWDKHRQPIGNYKIEPPGLFRGRGEHPKMGSVKKRIMPEDVIINCGKDSAVPKPPEGHRWKEVRHDNKVSWLVMWTENIRGNNKYVMLNASSRVKGERDWQKYEKARKLHRVIDKIRANYQADWKSKEMRIRQRAVALYFIDKLALRAGNEKDDDEADTVGCCSLRVEHITLHDHVDGIGDNVVEFDFLGKDSMRYNNKVSVEPRVYKNVKLFIENKEGNDELFDRLTTTILNQYLSELMEGLTAKVFRTYNASKTLQDQLDNLTEPKASVPEKMLAYNRGNRQVAILCNHQRSIPKTFEKSMETLKAKIDAKKTEINELKTEYKRAKSDYKNTQNQASQKRLEQAEKKVQRSDEALKKLEVQALDREENKDIALGTSKLNYLDPRISVGWCKKWNVPIEKIYSKTQRDKFRWAIDMATSDFHFYNYEGEIVLRNIDDTTQEEDELSGQAQSDDEE